MNRNPISTIWQRAALAVSVALTPVLMTASSLVVQQADAEASSHREAPLISMDAFADNTDTYVFVSPTNPDNVVLVASWIPFEGPEGGPNYFQWDPNVHYTINVDNNGDAVPDFTYVLEANEQIQNPLTFLYNTGPIGPDGTNWNRQQHYSLFEVTSAGSKTLLDNVLAPPVNIGSKSTPNYDEFDSNFIYTASDSGDDIKIYAGQTDDAFWVDLQVFDLLTLRGQPAPIGYTDGNNSPVDSVSGFNNHSLVIEIPISRLKQGEEPVLGVWAAANRKSMRVLNGLGGVISGDGLETNSGDYVQVSRLGMPLVNEVVLPYALKDAFNTLKPEQDLTIYTDPTFGPILQKSVEDPEVGRLLCGLYGVPLPGDADDDCSTEVETGTPRSGRGDIFDIFLTGMVLADEFMIHTKDGPALLPPGFNVNRPANAVPAEMIRINTNIKGDLCSPTPSRLGVLGGDACGFPNGRRLTDDIVEIELLAVAGAAYGVLDGRDADFQFNADLIPVLSDNVDFNDKPFDANFPYMATAQSGQEHFHQNPVKANQIVGSVMSLARDKSDDSEERQSGSNYFGSRDLELGTLKGKPQTVGVRFPNVKVPAGATIMAAHIEFTAEENDNGPANLQIYGEASDNATPFENKRHNISNRPKTTAFGDWANVGEFIKNKRHWSINFAPVVQEIVNRSGWQEGNAMAFIITGDGQRSAWSVDGKPGDAPMLYIEYEVNGSVQASAIELESVPTADVIARNTTSSTVLRGTDRGEEQLANDDDTEINEATGSTQEAVQIFVPVAKK